MTRIDEPIFYMCEECLIKLDKISRALDLLENPIMRQREINEGISNYIDWQETCYKVAQILRKE